MDGKGKCNRGRLGVGGLHKVHFQALGSAENLLTGSIMQDALVQCPGCRFPVLTNLMCAAATLLPSIKKPTLVPLRERPE